MFPGAELKPLPTGVTDLTLIIIEAKDSVSEHHRSRLWSKCQQVKRRIMVTSEIVCGDGERVCVTVSLLSEQHVPPATMHGDQGPARLV